MKTVNARPACHLTSRGMHQVGNRRRQSGAVLVIGLIILVVLTLLGVQSMRTNVAQERMASNMRDRNVAFQAAEAALREGERANPNGLGPTPFTHDPNPLPNPADWDGTAAVGGGTVINFTDGVADPAFHMGPPEYVRIGLTLPPEYRLIYPVTARGVGIQVETLGGTPQATSIVVIQSGVEPAN